MVWEASISAHHPEGEVSMFSATDIPVFISLMKLYTNLLAWSMNASSSLSLPLSCLSLMSPSFEYQPYLPSGSQCWATYTLSLLWDPLPHSDGTFLAGPWLPIHGCILLPKDQSSCLCSISTWVCYTVTSHLLSPFIGIGQDASWWPARGCV